MSTALGVGDPRSLTGVGVPRFLTGRISKGAWEAFCVMRSARERALALASSKYCLWPSTSYSYLENLDI